MELETRGRLFARGAALFLNHVEFSPEPRLVRAGNESGFFGNFVGLVGFNNRLVERVPPQIAADLNDLGKGFVFRFAVNDRFARPQAAAHDFGDEEAAAADAVYKALADDVTEGSGKALSNLLFFLARKHAEDAVDGLAGINRMEGAKHNVPGLRRRHRDFERFAVADFADQNRLGRLAKRGAEPVWKCWKIFPKLALADGGFFMGVKKLNRILERNDVDFLGLVQL